MKEDTNSLGKYPAPKQITQKLIALRTGNQEVLKEIAPWIEAELRRLAGYYFRNERQDHTLQPTALAHEAYLKLVDPEGTDWRDRAHFLRAAARIIRHILVDHARFKASEIHGGQVERIALDPERLGNGDGSMDFLALHLALERLAGKDPRQSEVVELRFFAGLTESETAEVLNISVMTVRRDWSYAKAWLLRELK